MKGHRMARSKLTKKLIQEARRLAAELRTEKEIAQCLGISQSTFYDYKARFPEFSEAIEKGREEWKSNQEAICLQRIVDADQWQAAAWLLERTQPEKYGKLDRLQATLDGGMTNEIILTVTGEEGAE